MGLSRQEYWSGLPCPPPGDLPDPGIKPMSLRSPALAGRFFITSATWEAHASGVPCCSAVSDSVMPWTVARHAALSMGFSRQEYWSGWPCAPSGDLPNPQGLNPGFPYCRWILYHLSHQGSPISGEIASL